MSNLYEILNVESDADVETLRRAYRVLARKHHPDISNEPGSHHVMAKINAAFETLIDPVRRMEYDAVLKGIDPLDSCSSVQVSSNNSEVSAKLLFRLKGHQTPIYALSFVPEECRLVSSSFDNELIYWDISKGVVDKRLKLESGVVATVQAYKNDFVIAAGSSEHTVSTWHIEEEKVQSWRINAQDWVCSVRLNPDGQRLAYGTVNHKFEIIRSRAGGRLFANAAHHQSITAIAWSEDGDWVASGSADASVNVWSVLDGSLVHHFPNIRSTVTAIAFSPDRKYLAVAAVDLSIRVFNLYEPGVVKIFFGHERPIEALSFHPKGRLLASTGRDGWVGLWDVEKGVRHSKIQASHQALSSLKFSCDGKRLAVGGLDKILRIWEIYIPGHMAGSSS